MKKFIIIAILLISNFGIFGGINTGGEENANNPEIVKNETAQEISVVAKQSEQKENIIEIADKTENKQKTNATQVENTTESKQEENKTEYQEKVIISKEIPKKENTTKPKETNNVANVKQETKKVEQKTQESKVVQEQKKEQPVVTKPKVQETKQEIRQTQESKPKQCTSEEHAKISGNTNLWFDTKEDAIAFVNAEQKKWGEKWANFEISDDEYDRNCPYSHKEEDCDKCKKWTLDLYYRKK